MAAEGRGCNEPLDRGRKGAANSANGFTGSDTSFFPGLAAHVGILALLEDRPIGRALFLS